MAIPILNIIRLTELIFTVVVFVLLLNLFILMNYKKLRKTFVALVFIAYFQFRINALYIHIL